MSITDPLFVVAPNYTAYLNWCRIKGYAPHNGSVRYVRGLDTLAPLRSEVRILFLEGWKKRRDWRAIMNRANVIGRRPS